MTQKDFEPGGTSDSGEVDKLVSDFLSELETLSDSLRVTPDNGVSEHVEGSEAVQTPQPPEDKAQPETERESETPQPVIFKPVRNIDVLLMDDVQSKPAKESLAEDELRDRCKARRQSRRRIRILVWTVAAVGFLWLLGLLYRLNPLGLIHSSLTPGTPASAAGADPSSTSAATPIDRIVPKYPSRARRLGIIGVVELDAEVDERGNVVRTTPVSGPALLRSAAAEAVSKCRFKPAQRDGINVTGTVRVSVPFNP